MFSRRRLSVRERAHDPDEAYADAFAMALLMPERLVREMWRRMRADGGAADIVIMAYRFGVPAEHMVYRLRDLGLIES